MGISLDASDRERSTPLHWACISSSQTVIKYLLAWGANVNLRDSAGYTPLHLAIMEVEKTGSFSTVKKLIMRGANIQAHDYLDRKPVDLARLISNEKIRSKAISILLGSTRCSLSFNDSKAIHEMKSSYKKVVIFFLYFISSFSVQYMLIYPSIDEGSWKFIFLVQTGFTLLFYMLSWLIAPGYLKKNVDGEFLLYLTKFDPKHLCPFCEVVQNPLSKHCFACEKCVEEFHHHCYWTNNCIGRGN